MHLLLTFSGAIPGKKAWIRVATIAAVVFLCGGLSVFLLSTEADVSVGTPEPNAVAAEPTNLDEGREDVVRAKPSDIEREAVSSSAPTASAADVPVRLVDKSQLGRTLALAAAADALPRERVLFADASISVPAVRRFVRGDEFDVFIDGLREESLKDPLAAEISRVYLDSIGAQVADNGSRISLSRFVCGLKVCVGEFAPGAANEDLAAWQSAFQRDPRTPHGVFAAVPTDDVEGAGTMRFVFSTDPTTSSVTQTFR